MFGPSRHALFRELARREQAWAIERQALLDRIMHLSGQTWTPPPVDLEPQVEIEEEPEEELELAWDASHLEDESVVGGGTF
jgi:hypothetical protein